MNKRTPAEDYVWGIIAGYEYHKRQIDNIMEELNEIKAKLEAGGVSGIRSSNGVCASNWTPWILATLNEEWCLTKQLKSHESVLNLISSWVNTIKNEDHHRDIFIDYVIEDQEASDVAERYNTTESNVRVIARRSVQRIAKKMKV